MLARVEEGEKAPLLVARALLPFLQTCIRRLQVILLQYVCLLLVRLCGEDKVLGYDGKLVQDQDVRGVRCGYVSYAECFWWVLKWIDLLLWSGAGKIRQGLLRQ